MVRSYKLALVTLIDICPSQEEKAFLEGQRKGTEDLPLGTYTPQTALLSVRKRLAPANTRALVEMLARARPPC